MRWHRLRVLLWGPRASGGVFQGQKKPFPTRGFAEGFKHTIQLVSIVVAELLHVVYALPTKWSWGLSHASPPGMVPINTFIFLPGRSGRSSAGNVAAAHMEPHRPTALPPARKGHGMSLALHHISLRSFPFFHREDAFLNPANVALCKGAQEHPRLRRVRNAACSCFNTSLLQLFSQIPLLNLSSIYRYWKKCLLTQRLSKNLLATRSSVVVF